MTNQPKHKFPVTELEMVFAKAIFWFVTCIAATIGLPLILVL